MPHFIRKTAVALTWAPNGQCRGVRLKRAGERCKVMDFWSGQADANHTATEILAQGARALATKDAACFIASSVAPGWDAADVEMPNLPPAQLRNALAFELRKHTPLPPEKLEWGFRLISRNKADNKNTYRIVFAKKDLWLKCCQAFAETAPVDIIVPAPAVIDPLCDKMTVTFPRGEEADAFLPTPAGRTYRPASTSDASGQPIPLTELIACDFIALQKLEELPTEQQYQFADALVLAAYGLTENASRDMQTLIQLPDAIRPHRSAALVVTACILLAVALASIVLSMGLTLRSNLKQQQDLQECLRDLDTEINRQRASIKPERLKKIQELKDELKGVVPNYPPLPLVLNSISEIISPYRERKPWISSRFTWNHDANVLKFSVEEPLDEKNPKAFIEQPELIDELADCPYVMDVRGNSSVINRTENKCIREFSITLGWPDKARRLAAERRNALRAKNRRDEQEKIERREKERLQARAKAVAAAQAQQTLDDDEEEPAATENSRQDATDKGLRRRRPARIKPPNQPPLRGINFSQPPQPPPPPPMP